ncbi:hypothetical protein Calab_1401 [Caldithrix abyssi DSM 13497]|uniref:Uncharacterized protein n=1 Tax=Caldithrix abyssi DSM 13497 TaxID=880073 RepID=H1XP32_CALAY|nr:hypothetical protein Calab_1401 [Caldithrix abyssi DSM 13497]
MQYMVDNLLEKLTSYFFFFRFKVQFIYLCCLKKISNKKERK